VDLDGIELDGDVGDAEGLVHAVVDLGEDAAVVVEVGDAGVAAHGEEAAGESPEVEVADAFDAGDRADRAVDGIEVDVSGGRLEQDVGGFADEAPAADEDEGADDAGDDGGGGDPAGSVG